MGSAHSSNGNCLSYVKAHATPHRRKTYAPPKEETRSIFLTERDFRGDKFKELLKGLPEINHVRVVVEDEEWWIPTDADLVQLQVFRHLTSVDFSGCDQITRKGLEYFTLHPGQIKTLILTDCPKITDKFFDHIVLFSQLERLDLRGCYWITDHGIAALAAMKYLRHLDISLCATQRAMSCCPSIGCSTITDLSTFTLARMTQLETLQMEGCMAVSDEGLIRLVTLRNLILLNLDATGLTNGGLKILKYFPELRHLDVANCYLSESQALEQMKAATKLTHLNVSKVPGVTDNFVEGISKYLNLTHLDISGCDHLSDNCLQYINIFSSLKHLNANACPGITGRSLFSLSSLSQLRSLHMSEATEVDCADVLSLIALEQLEMGALSAEDEQLSQLSDHKHLTDLTLHLSDSGTLSLRRHYRNKSSFT